MIRSFAIILCLLSLGFAGNAQIRNKTIKVTKQSPVKPPVLKTFMGGWKDSISVSAQEIENNLGLPLKATDDKKKIYTISSYQFLYWKKVATEDETGKISYTRSLSAERFTVTPLPALWLNHVKEDVKAGDEIRFTDVIVKDENGRVFYASNLVLTVR
jgi:adenine specific DNA methylase Mod